MSRLQQFVISSAIVFLSGCGPKVTDCVIDFPLRLAYCHDLDSDKKFDKPLLQMDKYSCMSPDDFSEFLRGNGKDVTVCVILNAEEDAVYCSTNDGPLMTSLEGIHKYSCFTADDLATVMRYIAKKKAKK